MAGRVAGKVAFITGAARGQGRSHAIRLAQEGADIIAIDLAAQIGSVPYAMSTPDDLAETVKEVEALDRRIVATQADVRDYAAVKAALDDGVAQLGHLDIASANAGIFSFGTMEELDETHWQDMIDVNLTGVWHAAKAAIPHLRAAGGGSMILTSSTAGLQAIPNTGHYNAAKHGVVGLMRTLALELAPDMIRVNSVHPTAVNTDMIQNLDRTVEELVEHPVPEEDDIIVRERVRTRRSVVLLADVSGSMRGERIRTAAATVGALAAELDRDDLAVVAFWSDAAVLSHLGQHVPAQRLLEEMLRIPARGLTNIAFPLQVAATELARVPARDARVVLLSDCVHNAGPDPRPLAARLPRLDVLLDTSGEQDEELARELARLGRGRLRLIRSYTDVAPALGAVFAG